jgi:transposase InsO family protein
LEQAEIYLSVRTVGRVLAMNRETYGLKKPKRSPHQKRQMPFQTGTRHRYWTVDVRYITNHRLSPEEVESNVYVISVLDNHSRCVLASSVSTRQSETAYLSVLFTAVERHCSPEAIVSDGAGVFKGDQARAGRNWSRHTRNGSRSTTPRVTGPTSTAKTDERARQRSWDGCPVPGTALKFSKGLSSRPALRAFSTRRDTPD